MQLIAFCFIRDFSYLLQECRETRKNVNRFPELMNSYNLTENDECMDVFYGYIRGIIDMFKYNNLQQHAYVSAQGGSFHIQERYVDIVEYQCIMDVFTLSSLIAQVRAICVNSIKGSCPKWVTI